MIFNIRRPHLPRGTNIREFAELENATKHDLIETGLEKSSAITFLKLALPCLLLLLAFTFAVTGDVSAPRYLHSGTGYVLADQGSMLELTW